MWASLRTAFLLSPISPALKERRLCPKCYPEPHDEIAYFGDKITEINLQDFRGEEKHTVLKTELQFLNEVGKENRRRRLREDGLSDELLPDEPTEDSFNLPPLAMQVNRLILEGKPVVLRNLWKPDSYTPGHRGGFKYVQDCVLCSIRCTQLAERYPSAKMRREYDDANPEDKKNLTASSFPPRTKMWNKTQ